MSKEQAKIKVKLKIFPDGDEKFKYISAQEYARFTDEEKDCIIECFDDKGLNGWLYLEKMKAMFPPVVNFKPVKWRTR